MGAKGHVQVIIPHVTESYTSQVKSHLTRLLTVYDWVSVIVDHKWFHHNIPASVFTRASQPNNQHVVLYLSPGGASVPLGNQAAKTQ